jgi:enolase
VHAPNALDFQKFMIAPEPEEVLHLLVQAITDVGYKPGLDGVSIALDLPGPGRVGAPAARRLLQGRR